MSKPRREPRPTRAERPPARRVSVRRRAPGAGGAVGPALDLQQVWYARELFWNNVVREMLAALAALPTERPEQAREVFDGRMAVITKQNARIPIAEIVPLFAFGMANGGVSAEALEAVEYTVFRVRTPAGEMYTLPLHEIRGIHSMTPELLKQLEQRAIQNVTDEDQERGPFGFAAFVRREPPAPPHAEPAI
ncbi:MAG TPA: hypothetical protein VD963_09905 [Phycisphaerales bacterium]|nr:hypothetical protein [Phycisphaerales bacterium]